MIDDDRFPLKEGEVPELKSVRFRTLGCYPLTGGIESTATTLDEIIDETLSSVSSERPHGRRYQRKSDAQNYHQHNSYQPIVYIGNSINKMYTYQHG